MARFDGTDRSQPPRLPQDQRGGREDSLL